MAAAPDPEDELPPIVLLGVFAALVVLASVLIGVVILVAQEAKGAEARPCTTAISVPARVRRTAKLSKAEEVSVTAPESREGARLLRLPEWYERRNSIAIDLDSSAAVMAGKSGEPSRDRYPLRLPYESGTAMENSADLWTFPLQN